MFVDVTVAREKTTKSVRTMCHASCPSAVEGHLNNTYSNLYIYNRILVLGLDSIFFTLVD